MGRIVVGLGVLAAGIVGLLAFREPVGSYTVDIAGSGASVGQLVHVECIDGAAVGPAAGDERAETECAAAADSVEVIRIVKLAVAGVVAVTGLWLIGIGLWAWWRDFRSRRDYERMLARNNMR